MNPSSLPLARGIFGFRITMCGKFQSLFANQGKALPAYIIQTTAEALATAIGLAGFYIYSIGFLATVLASLIGTWQTIPLLMAECHALLRRLPFDHHAKTVSPRSGAFRFGLSLITVSGIAFAFVDRPLALIVGYTIVASFVVPFIAAVLLYLNAKSRAPRSTFGRQGRLVQTILFAVLVLFLVIAIQEMFRLLRAQ